jgi:hypothetical protein
LFWFVLICFDLFFEGVYLWDARNVDVVCKILEQDSKWTIPVRSGDVVAIKVDFPRRRIRFYVNGWLSGEINREGLSFVVRDKYTHRQYLKRFFFCSITVTTQSLCLMSVCFPLVHCHRRLRCWLEMSTNVRCSKRMSTCHRCRPSST